MNIPMRTSPYMLVFFSKRAQHYEKNAFISHMQMTRYGKETLANSSIIIRNYYHPHLCQYPQQIYEHLKNQPDRSA